jgi:hypothetical protein
MPNSEVSFHVHKTATQRGRFVYTVGVWEVTAQGSHLRAICHVAPIKHALAAIGDELTRLGLARVPAPANSAAGFSKSPVRLRKLKTRFGGFIRVIGRFRTLLSLFSFRKSDERPVSSASSASPPAQ